MEHSRAPTCLHSQLLPKGFSGKKYPKLFPGLADLDALKKGDMTKEEFQEAYLKDLSKLDPHKVYEDLDQHILVCYEKSCDFCHRHIVADWLRSYGYQVEEL